MVFSKGNLAMAIRASCGFPLVFSPVNMDTMLLMDGGLMSNIPVSASLAEFPGSYVIAVDVTSPLWDKQSLANPARLVDQVVNIGLTKQKAAEKKLAAKLITPDLVGILNTDFSKADTIMARGYSASLPVLEKIRAEFSDTTTGDSVPCRAVDSVSPPYSFLNVSNAVAASLNKVLVATGGHAGIPASEFKKKVYAVLAEHGHPFSRIQSIVRKDSITYVGIVPGIIRGFSVSETTLPGFLSSRHRLG